MAHPPGNVAKRGLLSIGQGQLDIGFADLGVQINLWMHIVGSAALIAIVLLPVAHDWVTRRLERPEVACGFHQRL